MPFINDAEKIKATIREELGLLKQRYASSPELLKDIDEAGANIINGVDEQTPLVIMDSLTRQRFMYLMAGYLAVSDERKIWYYYHAIAMVLAIDEVETIVKKKFSSTYYDFRQRLNTYSGIVSRIKYHFDNIEEKTLKEGDTSNPAYVSMMDLLTKLPLIYQELDAVFILICRYTSLGQNTVPQQAISIFQQQYKKVSYGEERRTRETVERPSEG
jgi:hypothetical protein